MEHKANNPFSKLRTEQMGDSVWKYFVDEPFKAKITEKPLIFQGSRGTGKTMFLVCNSWQEKKQALESDNSLKNLINQEKHIGFYYLVDSRFVSSFIGKETSENIWSGLFNLYFNCIICLEIIEFVEGAISESLMTFEDINSFNDNISYRFNVDSVPSIDKLKSILEKKLIDIEIFSNSTTKDPPEGMGPGTLITELINALKSKDIFTNSTFHIYIDEFEKLIRYQQITLNTLLKQSNHNLVFDYGVITNGIKSYKVISGEEIRKKDDYSSLTTDSSEYSNIQEFVALALKICDKRLDIYFNECKIELLSDDHKSLEWYLKKYFRGKEFENITAEQKINLNEQLWEVLKSQARRLNYDKETLEKLQDYFSKLSPLKIRNSICLLRRKKNNLIPAIELKEMIETNTKRYKELMGNTLYHTEFLLCHELNEKKLYSGVKTFAALSSGVIRSFLELVEESFNNALYYSEDKLDFNNPRQLTLIEQSDAAHKVSKDKVDEIESYEPHGFRLKYFALSLGKIFRSHHISPYSTLGEVEQNHFTTEYNTLKQNQQEAFVLFQEAIKNKVIEQGESNKTKDGIEFFDFHINHIYCPYFGISHRRKRKIEINSKDIESLLIGSEKQIELIVTKHLFRPDESDSPNLFSEDI